MIRSFVGSPMSVLFLTLATIACISAVATPAHAGETCSAATIHEPFVLPDGQEFPAGKLSLCPAGRYSPVASFHQIRVDGRPVGILVGRPATSTEARTQSVLIVFEREADRRLHLLGYAVPSGDRTELHGFFAPARPA